MRDEAHAALDRLLEAVRRAMSADSEGARVAARRDARRCWVDLVRAVDRESVLSEAYGEAADPETSTDREWAMRLAVHVLGDLGGTAGAFRGGVATALGAVAGDIFDRVEGRSTPGMLAPLKRGRGNRARSIASEHGAWPLFARLVHYRSGRDQLRLSESLAAFGVAVGWDTFRAKQTGVPAPRRKAARETGAAVRRGDVLDPEQSAMRDELEAILSCKRRLTVLKNALSGRFDPAGEG